MASPAERTRKRECVIVAHQWLICCNITIFLRMSFLRGDWLARMIFLPSNRLKIGLNMLSALRKGFYLLRLS